MLKRFVSRINRKPSGQSFVELLLVLGLLAMILAAVVEFGFLLNNYMHVLDAAREAARYSNSAIAYDLDTGVTIDEFYYYTAIQAANTMTPVKLDPTQGDDIIISVLSVAGTSVLRHPGGNGWSLCANYAEFVSYLWDHDANHPIDPLQSVSSVSEGLADQNWYTCPAHASRLSDGDIQGRLVATAPNAGVLLVEILYNYPQILKLPVLSNNSFLDVKFSLVPDPIPVYVYTIMPISSAEPIQGP